MLGLPSRHNPFCRIADTLGWKEALSHVCVCVCTCEHGEGRCMGFPEGRKQVKWIGT